MMQASPSAAVVAGIFDLLRQILVALPTKPLIRLKGVCKQWRSIISSPFFLQLHHLRHPKRQTLFLLRSTDSRFYIFHHTLKRMVPFRFRFPDVNVLQSCNGLLLLSFGPFLNEQYYVFNPSTMQYRNLEITRRCLGLCLVFDPLKSPFYRVFCFRYTMQDNRVVSVYCSETHTWNHRVAFGLEIGDFISGVFWKDGFYDMKSGARFQRFSIEDGRTYQLKKPPRIRITGPKMYMTMESNGHMHSFSLSLRPDKMCLDVHELSHGDYGWSRIWHVDFNPVLHIFAGQFGINIIISVIGMVREERLEDSILLFHVPDWIMVYRFRTQTFASLFHFSDRCHGRGTHQFIETIASV